VEAAAEGAVVARGAGAGAAATVAEVGDGERAALCLGGEPEDARVLDDGTAGLARDQGPRRTRDELGLDSGLDVPLGSEGLRRLLRCRLGGLGRDAEEPRPAVDDVALDAEDDPGLEDVGPVAAALPGRLVGVAGLARDHGPPADLGRRRLLGGDGPAR